MDLAHPTGCALQSGNCLPIFCCASSVSGLIQFQGEIKLLGTSQTFLVVGDGSVYLLERKRVRSGRQAPLFELPQEVVRGTEDIQQPCYLSLQMFCWQHRVIGTAVTIGRM